MEREADGSPAVAARYELAQDLDVVVLGVEEAFVEGLLERHHHRRGRARNPPSQARLQHWSSMSAFLRWYKPPPTNTSIADRRRVEVAWWNPGELGARDDVAPDVPGRLSGHVRRPGKTPTQRRPPG
jgi:hypothetical protein